MFYVILICKIYKIMHESYSDFWNWFSIQFNYYIIIFLQNYFLKRTHVHQNLGASLSKKILPSFQTDSSVRKTIS